MVIGERLRDLREQKNLAQGDIEKRTGLLRCYVSRVENGHTFPSIDTLEKWARALDVPLYVLFYDGEKPPKGLPQMKADGLWGSAGKDARLLAKFRYALARTDNTDRRLLLDMARKIEREKRIPVGVTRRVRQAA